MIDTPIILFPHTHIAGPDIKKIQTVCKQLTICQPWFAEAPVPEGEKTATPTIQILRPPDVLKPKEDFRGIISEYQLWMKQNQDKGLTTFFQAAQGIDPSEETPWEIRNMISRAGESSSGIREEEAIQWHLILQMAREIEESRLDMRMMLRRLKQQESPLENALEDASTSRGWVEDLATLNDDNLLNDRHVGKTLEAWLGLFGEYLPRYDVLITFDRHVMEYAAEWFEGCDAGPSVDVEIPPSQLPAPHQSHLTQKNFPLLSGDGNARGEIMLSSLSGKKIILVEE